MDPRQTSSLPTRAPPSLPETFTSRERYSFAHLRASSSLTSSSEDTDIITDSIQHPELDTTPSSQLTPSSCSSSGSSDIMPPSIDFPSSYSHVRHLAKGGEGRAELFSHNGTGQLVVAKVIRASSFRPREANILQETSGCEAIVGYYGWFSRCFGPRQDAILLEYCSGGDLFQYWTQCLDINGGRLSEICLWRIFGQLAGALAFLHEGRGSRQRPEDWCMIVHRDIKLENVLVAQNTDLTSGSDILVKLADFGLSAFYDPANDLLAHGWGTPSFWPPEQTPDHPAATPAGDVWAVGAIIHELCHSFLPISDPQLMIGTAWWAANEHKIINQRWPPWHMEARMPRLVYPINLSVIDQPYDQRRLRPTPKYSDRLNHYLLCALNRDSGARIRAGSLAQQIENHFISLFDRREARERGLELEEEGDAGEGGEHRTKGSAVPEMTPQQVATVGDDVVV